MTTNKTPPPSHYIETFLNFIDTAKSNYQTAYNAVGDYDKLQQDLLHEIEDAANKAERNKLATKLHRLRTIRRKNKNAVKEYEEIVRFFEIGQNKAFVDRLKQVIDKQRKNEEYVYGEKIYKPRKDKATNGNPNR
jgi:t-SNARE complex subunit (syntaxin)